MSGLADFTVRCTGCRLRWIVFSGKPDKHCPFCGSALVRSDRG